MIPAKQLLNMQTPFDVKNDGIYLIAKANTPVVQITVQHNQTNATKWYLCHFF